MFKLKLVFYIILLAISVGLSAENDFTFGNQIHDTLIFNGKAYPITDYMMERFFQEHPSKKPNLEISSSVLDRGYIATYEIIDKQLFVVDIQIKKRPLRATSWKSVMNEVFPNSSRKKISWKTGFLSLPYGKLLNAYTVPLTYNNTIITQVRRGNIKEIRDYQNKELNEFKKRQYLKFKGSRRYNNLMRLRKKVSRTYNNSDFFIRRNILHYTKKYLVKV